MSLHLAEISLAVEPRAHGVVLMDQAGWHMTGKLEVPENISIIPLPAKCPELNPVEMSGNSCAITGCPTGGGAIAIFASIVAGVIAHKYIETPLTELLRQVERRGFGLAQQADEQAT